MSELVNPYIAGAPVVEARMFFGREDVFEWIQNSLTGRYADHILVIHGQRRVGKTSVLKQLGNRLPEKYIPVFFDLQGRTHTTIDRFLWWLAREIVRVLKQERDITIPPPEKEVFATDAEYFEHRFLPELRTAIGDHTLLLTFDEFDNLEESEVKEELARPLIDYLRRLMGESGLNFIFSIGSSGRKLENMQATYTEFFKTALYKKISFLNQVQTAGLVTRPVEGLLEYEPEAVKRIYGITSGHPYFTQLTCHELFSLCQRTGELRIRETDVEAVLDDVVERGTVNLKFTWDEASDIERWSLAALAHEKVPMDNHSLAEYLRKQRVRFSEPDLISGVLHLREKDILTEQNQFVIHLLRLWLQKNRTMEQVREELTEVNPIANRYIEIGMEFQDAGQYDRAIENFREALNVAPDHIQAQVNIALAYQAQGMLDQAVLEFGKALAMDDEDVSARSGLCSTHLALGDAAMAKNRYKDAITSYQKVLNINTEHTEARQRMAEINRQRAEKAMTDGRDEEALAAFAEALKFTPEDEALSQRYEQAKVEKRTKVVASLLAKAEKEQSARNWDTALSILQNALEIDPQNEKVQKRLETIREEQRKAGLAAILARADRARQAGRWGLVIAALEEYLAQEPRDANIQARIVEARQKLTEAQADEARTRAISLTRQERFEEALVAWDEYRKINPADEQTVQVEIEKIRKAQALANTYGEAQSAFTKKNYDRAVALFKEIVVQDENYRDASRRMAEAIELRRTARKWWQSRWLWGIVVSSVVLVVGWLAFRPDSPLMQALASRTEQPGQPTQPAGIQTSLPTGMAVTELATSTITPTALPGSWTRLSAAQFAERDDVTDIVVDPTDSGVIYASTAYAGVYKSIDGGNSWQPIMNGLNEGKVGSLAINPQEPDTIFAATVSGGLYKTTNGGQSWQLVNEIGLSPGEFPYINVQIAPWDSQVIFHSTGEKLYRSDDDGQTWQSLKETCPAVGAFVLHPSQAATLFATNFTGPSDPTLSSEECPGGVYKSSDGGESWDLVGMQGYPMVGHAGGVGSGSLYGIGGGFEIGGLQGEYMYVNAYVSENNKGHTAFLSQDGGVTWKEILDDICYSFQANSTNGAQVYCRSGSYLKVSNNAGTTWKNHPLAETSNFESLAVHFGEDMILMGGKGLYSSTDGGLTWQNRSSGLGAGRLELKIDPKNLTLPLYLQEGSCTQPGAEWPLHRSQDGKSWEYLTNESCGLAFDADGQTLYRTTARSTDGGETWVSFEFSESRSILAHPLVSGTLFRNDGGSVWKSTDYGQSWNILIENLNDSFLYSDIQGQVWYTNASARSVDGGDTWTRCANPLFTSIGNQSIAIQAQDSTKLYAATPGQGVMVSEDGCQTWQPINNGLGNLFVNSLAINRLNSNTIYAGTDGGVYISLDGGQTWGVQNNGLLGATVVYSVVVDISSQAYAATPYGIFKLEGK